MSYFRHRYSTFEEFQREALFHREDLGKDELELLQAMEDDDLYDRLPQNTRGRRRWD
ncbi:MAG: hypothetical protein R3A51_18815 [Nannocystaceae bacterium]|nr:hypothetical protein [Myxococcales bacterium]